MEMIEEAIEEPEEPKQQGEKGVKQEASFSEFDLFVQALAELNQGDLHYSHCNRHIKLKESEYCTDAEVIHYFKEVFSKKTSLTVRRKWHIKDKFVLVWVVFKLCQKKGRDEIKMKFDQWQEVENILRLPKEFLMRKWICLIRHTTYNYHWSFSEERSLRKCMESNTLKSKWSDLAIAIYKGSGADILRTCKDVREHWKNYLDPQLKKAVWTPDEDSILLRLVQKNGKKWSFVSRQLEGRTENQVKNRYVAIMKKSLKKRCETRPKKLTHHSSSSSSSESQSQPLLKLEEEQEIESFIKPKVLHQPIKKQSFFEFKDDLISGDLDNYIQMAMYKPSIDEGFFVDI